MLYDLLDNISDFFGNIYDAIESVLPSDTSNLFVLALVSAITISVGSILITA